MPVASSVKYFSPVGRMHAEQLVTEINDAGGEARIDMTWEDYGAAIMTETVLAYSRRLKMWYQALSPADINTMNAGTQPNDYKRILKSATN